MSADLRTLRQDFESGRIPALDYRERRLQVLAADDGRINHLVVLEGGPRQTHEVRQSEYQIGSDPNAPDNDLIIGIAEVSGRHALFRFEENSCWVKDLGSTNGTFVNGQRLGQKTKMQIRPGDQVALSQEFILVFEGDRDESSSEGRRGTPSPVGSGDSILSTGGFRLLGGVVLEPNEYVILCQHIKPPELLRALAYLLGLVLLLSIVFSPLALWAWRKHTRGPGYLCRYYLTNRRAIEAHERAYRNIWYEDLVDVFMDSRGRLVAKDRPRFGLPTAIETQHRDSRSIVFEALGTSSSKSFSDFLKEAREHRGELVGHPPNLGPY
jgi:pSer/pThr/pTyr-binding forkhead associated (FHA) protein